eukprot:6203290-Pleurochrysis_carterae.AAC.1
MVMVVFGLVVHKQRHNLKYLLLPDRQASFPAHWLLIAACESVKTSACAGDSIDVLWLLVTCKHSLFWLAKGRLAIPMS